ncbi:MAG: methyltransferase domain-containing protein [Ferruginibacter sp.]
MHEIDMMLKLQLEGEHEEARKLSDKLEEIGPDEILDGEGKNTSDIWLRHSFNRGWFLIQDGDYQAGCQRLESGRYLNVYGSPPLHTEAPIFNPGKDDITGKSIIVSLEGGYGDEIIHARFATSYKKLGAAKVYIACAPELVSVFERIEGVDGVILRDASNTVAHDFWVPGFSAGWVAGHTFEDFPNEPYLKALPESVEIWKGFIKSDKIKVGIRWAGNPKFEHQQFRKFPEEFITNLSKYKELEIYSLQRDHNLVQLPEGVTDLQHFLLSWEDTMAAIENLDIVITSCTSIAHLAAAMGKETWVLTPILPYHTWTPGNPDTDTTPYYKCTKIFRQKTARKWNDTFQKMYAALEEKFELEHIDLPDEDKTFKKLNMGSGVKKLDGFVNADPKVDFNEKTWNFKDNEFDHIACVNVLQNLGNTSDDFINAIKEMYRITANGGIWEIEVPHWRSDTALNDPTSKRMITIGTFNLFSKKNLIDKIKQGQLETLLAFDHNIDIEICDVQFQYTEAWQEQIKNESVKQEEVMYALQHFNNVASATRLLIQVHKPGRIDNDELETVINELQQQS